MQQPPSRKDKSPADKSSKTSASSSSSNGSSSSGAPQSGSSRGQIHVKLIQARGLNVQSLNARPYVVVQFENNEFVSRDPTEESEKEAKGTATALSRNGSSSALSALGAIGSRAAIDVTKRRKSSTNSSPVSSVSSGKSNGTSSNTTNTAAVPNHANGLFARLSAHNPVWKHEVSLRRFPGAVQVKPILKHDHTVDEWYKYVFVNFYRDFTSSSALSPRLRPLENEEINGDMRLQITYEQYKTKRALTPRDFEFLKLIGRGTFGKVFQVRKRDTKRIYAMKVLSKKEIVAKKEVAHTIGERKILQRSLESPFLVGLKFSFQTETDLYLVTDFKSGGELFWHLQRETRFTEERARFYIAELILALEHLHKYDIVYRAHDVCSDLKPENILLDATGHVALCDFGLSKADLRADELTTTFCGTTEYLAPEILLDEQGYSKIVDFWSLGVLLFEMCCGWSPFYAEDTQQMYKNICFGKIRFPKGVINEDGKQFVKGLLNRNPKHRLGASRDASELKEHPFFKMIDWDALAKKQVTPPFKPDVESDESTACFDPEFTSADIREIGIEDIVDLDEDDPSEAWVSRSVSGSYIHTPNGPLGSDQPKNHGITGLSGLSISTSGHIPNGPSGSSAKSAAPRRAGELPWVHVFGRERGATPAGRLKNGAEASEAVDDEEVPDENTEDEAEDTARPAGRYAHARRKGLAFTGLDDV
ncbi:Serine/threonine-protein kinase [Salix suchowensis]|nr:Serine/threonine-protein kinase [Salix suchowensis]